MTTMTGAEYLATTLERYGVTHAFLVPTILSRTLVAMEERTEIARIVTHGEKAAAYMADGYARASGRVGICMAQTVGAANLAAGLQDAYLGGAPVLAMTGGPFTHSRNRHFYQEIEAFPLFKPVTKSSALLDTVERLPDVLRQAFRTATTGRPGPVHIELAGHAGDTIEDGVADLDTEIDPRFGSVPPFRPEPEEGAVAEALRVIGGAQRPIIVAGGGVRASGAAAQLVAFAERLSLPVATSLNGKELIPADHPLSVGVVGLYSRKSANRAVYEADLVVYIGSQTGSQVTFNWQVPPPSTRVVHIDIEPSELGRHYVRTTPVLGDAKVVLQRLLEATAHLDPPDRAAWTSRTQQLVSEYYDEYGERMRSDAEPMRPERLCAELSELLPAETLLLADTGHAGMWTGGMIDLKEPGQGFQRAAGSLGWGLPATLGAKLASPGRPVLLFTGDGGLWYHLSELETAVRWNIDVVVLVNNNRSLNQEIGPYLKAYDGELRGRHHELWHFEDIDFAKVAQSVGATGIRVRRPGELAGALDKAFSTTGPVVVDVVTDIDVVAPVAFLPT